jgi:hypothetical protein
MSVIECLDCNGKVSLNAPSCIHCGSPNPNFTKSTEVIPIPKLAKDLSVSSGFFGFHIALLQLTFSKDLNPDENFPNGNVAVGAYKNGLKIYVKESTFDIHYSQITGTTYKDYNSTIHEQKSVIGRALIGGVLLGGVGAVVGGISGVKTKEVLYNQAMTLKFYNVRKKRHIILILASKDRNNKYQYKRYCEAYKAWTKANS